MLFNSLFYLLFFVRLSLSTTANLYQSAQYIYLINTIYVSVVCNCMLATVSAL